MKVSRIVICCAAFGLLSCGLWAQEDKKEVRKGNSDYGKANYKEAEIHYRKAMVKDSTSFAAIYDLANALYSQKDYEGAKNIFDKISEQAPESSYGDRYFFNKGNTSLQRKDYASAIEDFKQSLICNPSDIQAKESYLYAKKMLEKQQNKDSGDNDKQQQDNKKDNTQDQNQNQNNQNKSQEQQPQEGDNSQQEISAQQAQQMLRAIQAKEKETQEKVEKAKALKAKTRQKEKNW